MRLLTLILVSAFLYASEVEAIVYPHDATNDVQCENCHTSHQSLGSRGYDNMCLACHKAGSPSKARKFPFSPGDAANPYRTYTSSPPPGMAQTSHTWVGSDTLAKAGALPPKNTQMTKSNLIGSLSCVKCHNIHAPRSSATNSAPFLRALNDRDQMCLDCHRPRNTRDHRKGTHPVNFNYTSATSLVKIKPAEFQSVPVSSNPDNPTASTRLKNGALLCTSCHGAHYTDSDRTTFDSRTSVLTPSPLGKGGYLLRTDLRGPNAASVNMCTNCHIKQSHNKRGQNVQCGDCHSGHVDLADGSVPNVYVVRRYMNISTSNGAVRNKAAFLQSTSAKNWRSNDALKPGVCQACHAVPTGGTYPPEHTSTSGKVCMGCHVHNSATGAFSASCSQCHGFPPSQNVAGGPNGYGGNYFALSGVSEATSPHATHAGGSGNYSFGCSQCHQGNNHNDANFQDVFRNTAGTLAETAGAVPAYNTGTRQCSNLYCHSNGNPRGGALVTATVTWPNGSINDCSSCHQGMPGTNAHSKHLAKYDCHQCHAATVEKDSFTTISDRSKHVNAEKDVAFANTTSTGGGVWDDTAASCTTVYCHSQGTSKNPPFAPPLVTPVWTATLTCAGCHGDASSGTLSGVHGGHVNNAAVLGTGNSFGCADCHAKTVSGNTTISSQAKHVDRFKDYSGVKAGRAASCANFYCHSNGNTGSIVYTNPPTWNSGSSLGCNGCHGTGNPATGAPDYASGGAGSATANSHNRHVAGAGITDTGGCANCHSRTVDAAVDGKLRNYSTLHLNKSGDVSFRLIGGKTGSYNTGTSQCSNTYCHGVAASPQWGLTVGVPLACNTCHGGNSSLPGAHNEHWETATLAGSYTTPAGNSGTTTSYQFACSSCHLPGSAMHAGGPANANGAAQVFFGYTAPGRSGSYSHGTSQGNDNGFAWTNGTGCSTTYCHSNGNGGAPANAAFTWSTPSGTLGCTGCHGNAAGNTLSGEHQAHVNNAALGTGNSFGCVDCHAKTVSSDTVLSDKRKHVNKFKDYSGVRALGSGHYFNDTKQCLNIYCHSNGNPQSLAFVNPPAWNGGGSLGCNGCHGTTNAATGAPDYASGGAGTATANSHNRHVASAGITDTKGCANCHYRTVNASVAEALRNYSTLHLNKAVDVSFKLIGGKTGTYNTGTAQCSSTYCHGTSASPQWGLTVGVPLACNTCHAATATDAGWSAASAHKLHWEDMVLPASYTMNPGNSSSDPSQYRFACPSCHAPGSSTAVHAAGPAGANGSGQVFFGYTSTTRKGTYTYGGATAGTDNGFAWTAGTNCNTTYCHSNGQVGAGAANGAAVTWSTTADTGCTACHGNATSNTLSGEHQAHVNNDAVLGISFKCSDCHAKTVGAASDTVLSDKRNHVNKFRDYSGSRAGRSAACTNFYCHSNGKGTFVNPPAWTAGASLDCKGCHGSTGGAFTSAAGEPNYTSGGAAAATANSHQRHVDSAGDCVKCHQRTTSSGTAIVSGATDHIDRTIDVRFSKVNGFTTYSGVYNSGGKTCSATYCHGGAQTSPAWGMAGPLACDTCHKASNTLPAGHTIHFADAAAFTAYTATPGNRSSAGSYRFACSSCHGRNAGNHAGGPVAANSAANIFFALSSAGKNPSWALGGSNNTDGQGFKYTTGVNGTCNATYCHSNGQGGNGSYVTLNWATPQGTIGCTGCHGNATSGTLSGEHNAHANNAAVFGTNNSLGCIECHAKTVSNSSTIGIKSNHVNKFKDYSGAKANDSYNAGTKTCTSAYCHSNGNLRNITYVNPPAWNAGASRGCNGCHGTTNTNTGAPDYASGGASSTTANSHNRHVADAGITDTKGCATCHYRTVSAAAAGALRNYSTLHLNKNADVSFKLLNGKTGTYDSANQQCANTYCHGTAASPKWGLTAGVPLACNTCHSAKPDDAYWASNSAHKVHLEAAVLPSKYVNYSGNVSSAGSYRFTCSSCHLPGSGKAVHSGGPAGTGAGQVFFGYTTPGRVGTYSYGAVQGTTDNGYAWTAGTNCTTSYCHSNGAGSNGSSAVVWTTASHNATTNTRCKTCHGYTSASGTAINTGSHGKHIGATYGLSCGKCHSLSTDGAAITDKSKHVNKVKNVAWDATNTGGTAYASPNCSGIYCHSAGTVNVAPYAAPNMAVSWGGSLGANCNGCHKGNKASGDPITRGSHLMHIANYGMNCVKCHAATVSDTRIIGTPGNHVNKFVNVAFNNTTTAVIGTAKYNGSVASVATPVAKTPGTGYGQCTNTYCHSTVQGASGTGAPTAYGTPTWGAAMSCSSCHRGPSNHGGTAADGTSGLEIATGSHTKHLSYSFNFGGVAQKCTACHKWDASKAFDDCNQCHTSSLRYTKHVNGQIDVAFDAAFGAGTYGGTVKPGDAYGNCASVYCHSNGTSVASGSIPANTTVNWGTAGPLACNACHGNPPAYANGTPKKNNHAAHGAYTCDKCHFTTTNNGTTIASTDSHVNKAYTVDQGAGITFAYVYNAAGGTCTNISCHGGAGTSAQWGTTLTCASCHGSTSDVDNYVYNTAPMGKIKMAGEWDTTGHGKPSGTYTSGNAAAAFTVANACLYCHDTGVVHGHATNVFRLKNYADATWGKNGACMSCHATGSAGITIDSVLKNGGKKVSAYHYGADHTALKSGGQFCWDCHDPHGDGNVYMIHSAVAKVSSSTTSAPTTTASVTFTAFATGTDYAGANATKICNACHTTASHYAGASGDGHNSGARCTSCHSHNNSDNKAYGFTGGESNGGQSCASCHSDLFNADQSKYSMHSNVAGITYKHYLDNTNAVYYTALPNGPSLNVTSRNCLMCHVDHDMFKVTASSTAGRAFNLRPYPQQTPTAGTDTDLTLCVSCHYQVSDKFVGSPNGEASSLAMPFPGLTFANATTIVKNSTHGYVILSQEFADATLGNTAFKANCTKCHNDSIGRNGAAGEGAKSSYDAQDGAIAGRYRMGNHMSTANNFFTLFGNPFYQGQATSATNTTNATITVTGAGWTANQWANYYVVVTGGTGQSQRKRITSNTATVLTLAGTFASALNSTSTFDIVRWPTLTDNVCFACHSKNGQGKSNGANLDWYGQEPISDALEGILDLFQSDSGTATGGTNQSLTDSSKAWTANQWTNFYVKMLSGDSMGQQRRVASNTATVLTLESGRRLRSNILPGDRYQIVKPSLHPLDNYGRHVSIERNVAVATTWNRGDTGTDSSLAVDTATTTVTDITKYWGTNVWNGMKIYFPFRNYSATVNSNTATTVTFNKTLTIGAGEGYFIGTRHVSCADCHNSHSAQIHPEGKVTSSTATTLTATAAINSRWRTDEWKGFLLRVRQYTGATDNGKEQLRYITAFNPATGQFTVSLPWGSIFTIDSDDHFEVMTGEKWTSAGQDGGRAGTGSMGVWGTMVSGWAAPAGGALQNPSTLTFTKIENVYKGYSSSGGYAKYQTNKGARQADLCVKCHSYYSFGTKLPTTTTPGPNATTTALVAPAPVSSTDIATEFNPNNSSHHAVYARGNNQPIKANYGNTSATYGSWYNSSWPKYSTVTAGHTISISNGTATLAGGAALPSTVLPGWFIYVGADSITATTTATLGTGTTANGTGFLEITSITSTTSFTVRAMNSSGAWVTNPSTSAATANWFVTAGLGNSFVPPFGPWSILRCTDCHGSTKTDPIGPHASANDWLVKSIDTGLVFEWYNGTSVTTVTPNSGITDAGEKRIFCYNCHRRDVYRQPALAAAANAGISRLSHNNFTCSGLDNPASNYIPQTWALWCRHCHTGDKVGGTHGTNKYFRTGSGGITNTTNVKRFLNGATWDSYGKATVAATGTCWTQASKTSVSQCNNHDTGGRDTGTATYDYW